MTRQSRREFLHNTGLSAAMLPFLGALPSLGFAAPDIPRKQRLVILFSPNGTIPKDFWPDQEGELQDLKRILKPLEPFKDQMLTLKGVNNKLQGDGDRHMRGIGCLLTGIELFPGNIQGGSDTPAGWASGLSIDQEIAAYLQANEQTRTRFGSLVLGVNVPNRADTWTRMSYAGPNRPIAPIDDPYEVLKKMYGDRQEQMALKSVLDDVTTDLKKLGSIVSDKDRRMLDEHATFIREMERQLEKELGGDENAAFRTADGEAIVHNRAGDHAMPVLEPGVIEANENLPKLSAMQIELLVHGFAADFMRTATLQITRSVGTATMKWLGIDESHHSLSHEPDSNEKAVEDLVKINTWYAEQVALLCKKLADTPEPNGEGSLLDNTTVVWTNELGKGNSHTLNDIPWVCIGGGLGWNMGRSLQYDKAAHNRLLMAMAHSFGHNIETFGNPEWCDGGVLDRLV